MDILFYQVIHNKYLFNLIINQFQNDQYVEFIYDDKFQIKLNSRIKFKDIVSLEFIVKNQLYSLLKCKLESNEYIQLDCSLGPWINSLDNRVEIFKYFLDNSSIKNLEYINNCLLDLDNQLIEIACSHPYSIQILPSRFNLVKPNQYQHILELFFKYSNNNQLVQYFKNNSIKLNFNSSIFEIDQYLEILLNNNQYYNIPKQSIYYISSSSSYSSSSSKYNCSNNIGIPQQSICGAYSSSSSLHQSNNNNNSNSNNSNNSSVGNNSSNNSNNNSSSSSCNNSINCNNIGITIQSLYSISSFSSPNNNNNLEQSFSSMSSSSSSSSSLLLSSSSSLPNNSTNSSVKMVHIDKILFDIQSPVIQNKLLDLKYYKYSEKSAPLRDEIEHIVNNNSGNSRILKLLQLFKDNGIHNEIWFSHLLDDLNNLKLYLSNNKNNWKGIQNELVLGHKGWKNITPEFIKYYLSLEVNQEYGYFICDIYTNEVIEKLNSYLKRNLVIDNKNDQHSGGSIQEFLDIIKSAPPNSSIVEPYRQLLERSNYQFFKDRLIIQDTVSIDIISKLGIGYQNFIYSTLSLLKYLKRKFKYLSLSLSKLLLESNVYGYLLQNAIKDLDLDLIKEVEKESNEPLLYTHLGFDIKSTVITKDNDEKVNAILNYYISNDQIEGAFKVLDIFSSSSNYHSPSLNSSLSKYCKGYIIQNNKKQDNKILSSWVKLFIKCIIDLSFSKLQILLNHNFNPIVNYPSLKSLYKKVTGMVSYLAFKASGRMISHPLPDSTTTEEFIQIIKVLVDSFSGHINQDNSTTIQQYINELYKRFIQIPKLQYSSLIQVYNHIKSSQIKLSHSSFHSFYYLSIKSPKFIKYLVEFPTFKSGYHSIPDQELNHSDSPIEDFPNRYLNPSVFTFEFIFNDQLQTYGTSSSSSVVLSTKTTALDPTITKKSTLASTNEDLILKELFQLSYSFINTIKESSTDNETLIKFILEHNLSYLLAIKRNDLFLNHFAFITSTSALNQHYQYHSKHLILDVYSSGLISELIKHPNKFENKDQLSVLNKVVELNHQHQHQYLKEDLFFINRFFCFRVEFSMIRFLIKYHSIIFSGNSGSGVVSSGSNIVQGFAINSCIKYIPFNLYSTLLKLYPNDIRLKVSESFIDQLIASDYILFIKFLYQNDFIGQQLSSYLKNQLLNHKEYKYINWL